MNLEQLGKQYLERSQILVERIHKLNNSLPKLTGNDKILMKRRIVSLYCDAAECRNHAKKLMSYHERKHTP